MKGRVTEEIKGKLKCVNRKKAVFTAVLIVIIFYRVVFAGGNGVFERREKVVPSNVETVQSTDENSGVKKNNENPLEKKDEVKNITVYISGAVANPGVISIESDKRLDDAIKKVGGLSKDADVERINLAMNIEDSQHYIIPAKGDNTQPQGNQQAPVQAENAALPSGGGTGGNGKVNINSADQTQLETIPGVGPSTAKKIIDYREKEGKFSAVEDIKNVSGIGDKKFENMKDSIDVQ